jgi:aspartyl-tRNA(Asn)/glutamyl-tRNA(Gln) amidotransferase subunit C
MNLSLEEVFHLAELARIELTTEEAEQFRNESQAILGYVERLAAVDTSSVTHLEMGQKQALLAKDVASPLGEGDRAALVKAFPKHLGALLSVPGVFEHPKKS